MGIPCHIGFCLPLCLCRFRLYVELGEHSHTHTQSTDTVEPAAATTSVNAENEPYRMQMEILKFKATHNVMCDVNDDT